jgi:hypothetical protein
MNRIRRSAARAIGLAAALAVAMAVTANATTMQLVTSSDIPAAEGTATFHLIKNQNTEIKLHVKHLAPPERVAPGSSVFVVWVRGLEAGSQPQNMGALRVDKGLSGKLRAITALPAFDLFITCEPAPTVTAPTGKELLPLHYTGR